MSLFTEAATHSGGAYLTYGPIVAALASVGAVVVSLMGRNDKRTVDRASLEDDRANTAIRGLTESYDRVNIERKEQEDRADAAELKVRELSGQINALHEQIELEHQAEARLVAQIAQLERKLAGRPATKRTAKKTTAKKTTGTARRRSS